MSLGFLTESALVPSKAKPIHVDSKSLFDLKAVVFQKEQERQQRRAQEQDQDDSGRPAGKYAHLKGRKRSGEHNDRVFKGRNRGVEKRMRRDEDAHKDQPPDQDDERAWHKKSTEALKRKAKLYDAMMAGKRSSVLAAECLVDFDAKRELAVETLEKELVEITDEFGRSQSVVSGGDEHKAFLRGQQQEAQAATIETPVALSNREDDAGKASSGSFVVSQWEKRFNSTEKMYLQEVHESVKLAKTTGSQLDRQTKKQLRLQKLKAQAAAASCNAGSVDKRCSGQDEAEASAQATDFLTSLM